MRQKVVFLTSTLGEYLNFPTKGTGRGKDAQNCTFLSTWSLHVKEKKKIRSENKENVKSKKRIELNFFTLEICVLT